MPHSIEHVVVVGAPCADGARLVGLFQDEHGGFVRARPWCRCLFFRVPNLVNEIYDVSPQLCVFDLHKGFRERKSIRRGENAET